MLSKALCHCLMYIRSIIDMVQHLPVNIIVRIFDYKHVHVHHPYFFLPFAFFLRVLSYWTSTNFVIYLLTGLDPTFCVLFYIFCYFPWAKKFSSILQLNNDIVNVINISIGSILAILMQQFILGH